MEIVAPSPHDGAREYMMPLPTTSAYANAMTLSSAGGVIERHHYVTSSVAVQPAPHPPLPQQHPQRQQPVDGAIYAMHNGAPQTQMNLTTSKHVHQEVIIPLQSNAPTVIPLQNSQIVTHLLPAAPAKNELLVSGGSGEATLYAAPPFLASTPTATGERTIIEDPNGGGAREALIVTRTELLDSRAPPPLPPPSQLQRQLQQPPPPPATHIVKAPAVVVAPAAVELNVRPPIGIVDRRPLPVTHDMRTIRVDEQLTEMQKLQSDYLSSNAAAAATTSANVANVRLKQKRRRLKLDGAFRGAPVIDAMCTEVEDRDFDGASIVPLGERQVARLQSSSFFSCCLQVLTRPIARNRRATRQNTQILSQSQRCRPICAPVDLNCSL